MSQRKEEIQSGISVTDERDKAQAALDKLNEDLNVLRSDKKDYISLKLNAKEVDKRDLQAEITKLDSQIEKTEKKIAEAENRFDSLQAIVDQQIDNQQHNNPQQGNTETVEPICFDVNGVNLTTRTLSRQIQSIRQLCQKNNVDCQQHKWWEEQQELGQEDDDQVTVEENTSQLLKNADLRDEAILFTAFDSVWFRHIETLYERLEKNWKMLLSGGGAEMFSPIYYQKEDRVCSKVRADFSLACGTIGIMSQFEQILAEVKRDEGNFCDMVKLVLEMLNVMDRMRKQLHPKQEGQEEQKFEMEVFGFYLQKEDHVVWFRLSFDMIKKETKPKLEYGDSYFQQAGGIMKYILDRVLDNTTHMEGHFFRKNEYTEFNGTSASWKSQSTTTSISGPSGSDTHSNNSNNQGEDFKQQTHSQPKKGNGHKEEGQMDGMESFDKEAMEVLCDLDWMLDIRYHQSGRHSVVFKALAMGEDGWRRRVIAKVVDLTSESGSREMENYEWVEQLPEGRYEYLLRPIEVKRQGDLGVIVLPRIKTICGMMKRSMEGETLHGCLEQMFSTMSEMRQDGIFHGDIKPSNMGILDGKLVLFDLEMMEREAEGKHFEGRRGTRGYWAPEVEEEGEWFTIQADLYSWGRVIQTMVNGNGWDLMTANIWAEELVKEMRLLDGEAMNRTIRVDKTQTNDKQTGMDQENVVGVNGMQRRGDEPKTGWGTAGKQVLKDQNLV